MGQTNCGADWLGFVAFFYLLEVFWSLFGLAVNLVSMSALLKFFVYFLSSKIT